MLEILERGIRVFSGPDFTVETLRQLQLAVEDMRVGRQSAGSLCGRLASDSPALAKEFREWASVGINFVTAMATVAAAIFTYMQAERPNRDATEVAIEALESCYGQPAPDLRVAPLAQSDLSPKRGAAQKSNRKQRRAEAAKERRDRR